MNNPRRPIFTEIIYLSVRNALPMISLRQVKVSYIPDFIGANISLVFTVGFSS